MHGMARNHVLDLIRFNHQRGEQARRQTAISENSFQCQRALRHVRGVLQHHRITRHQRRRGSPEHLPEGKIPRHHRQHHAQGVIRDIAFTRIGFHGFVAQIILGMLRIEITTGRAFFHLGARFAQQFSHLLRDQGRVLVALDA